MTLRERLKAVTNNFAWEQDWNIQEYAVHKRDIDYRRGKADAYPFDHQLLYDHYVPFGRDYM